MSDSGDSLDADTLFALLSTARRRHIVDIVAEAHAAEETPLPVGKLARRLTAAEMGVSVDDAPKERRRTVYASITQGGRNDRPSELGKLAAAGIIDYDDTHRNKHVAAGPHLERAATAKRAFEGVVSGEVRFEEPDESDDHQADGGAAEVLVPA